MSLRREVGGRVSQEPLPLAEGNLLPAKVRVDRFPEVVPVGVPQGQRI